MTNLLTVVVTTTTVEHMNTTPSICQGNNTCDPRQPHICYNDLDVAEMDAPWATTTTA